MQEKTWKDVWIKKNMEVEENDVSILELLNLAGYEKTGAEMNKIYYEYLGDIENILNIHNNDTIYDVGCAGGNLLYYFYNKGFKVGGVDFSKNLIDVAKKIMPLGEFEENEAINLETSNKYDYVFASSIFHYFENYDYAKNVMNRMFEKSNKKIVLLDIPDIRLKEKCENERKEAYGEEEYNKKFSTLKHLYYDKELFEDFAEQNNCKVNIFNQILKNSVNSKYRFNCIIEKQ